MDRQQGPTLNKDRVLGLMLCWHHLKILNFQTRGHVFSFCTGLVLVVGNMSCYEGCLIYCFPSLKKSILFHSPAG